MQIISATVRGPMFESLRASRPYPMMLATDSESSQKQKTT